VLLFGMEVAEFVPQILVDLRSLVQAWCSSLIDGSCLYGQLIFLG
jgi:hypothetical protein